MIVFVFRFHFQHNVASGSDTHSSWEDCSKSAVLIFVPFLKIQDVLKNPKFAYSVDSCRLSSSVFLISLAGIYSMKSQMFFCASWFFFADLRFHSVQREFQSPKSPRPSTMIHISSYSNLISETTSFFSKLLSSHLFSWNVTIKLIFGLVPCIGNQVYCSLLRLWVEMFSPETPH